MQVPKTESGLHKLVFVWGCGCADALFIARRKVENAWARKNGNLLLLALDWAKVFDSISPASLINAMSRFGIPYHSCLVVSGIYDGRPFSCMVRDEGVTCRQLPQCCGISQSCLLFPFLFSDCSGDAQSRC